MLDATREVLVFSADKTRLDLDTDRMLCLSLVHLLEIIGEAAVGVSSEFREKYPQIPHLNAELEKIIEHGGCL